MRHQHLDLFPTRIWIFDLAGPGLDPTALADAVLSWRAADAVAENRSTRNGWSSDRSLFDRPAFAALRAACDAAFSTALADCGRASARMKLAAWANVHDRGGYNQVHLHRGSLLSGSCYLAVPEGAGRLFFRDPRPGVQLTAPEGRQPNALSSIGYQPAVGQLVVFPGWLEHGVEPNESDAPRISIAMNADPA